MDRPADPRPVRALRLAGLAGGGGSRDRGAFAGRHPGARTCRARTPGFGREDQEARARCDRPRRHQGGARGRRRTVLVRFRTSRKPRPAAARWPTFDGEIIDGANLVRLAEAEILVRWTHEAKLLILDAAKRVSIVTAVSPRALVDIAYVVFESGRLIRRLAELYGGRPGTLGFFRLARDVLAHLAVTGSLAAGDSLVQQLVGHGLAARLSAKLGEGVVNGMMTVRIGIAAMETARPLPVQRGKAAGRLRFPVGVDRLRDPQGTQPEIASKNRLAVAALAEAF